MARNHTARLARLEFRLPVPEELSPVKQRCITALSILREVIRRCGAKDADAAITTLEAADTLLTALGAAADANNDAACDAAAALIHKWAAACRERNAAAVAAALEQARQLPATVRPACPVEEFAGLVEPPPSTGTGEGEAPLF